MKNPRFSRAMRFIPRAGRKVVPGCLVILLGLVLVAGSASGAEYPIDRGSTLISGAFAFSHSSGNLYEDWDGNSLTNLTVAASMLSFTAPQLGLGGNLVLARASQGDESLTSVGIGPKLAFFAGSPGSNAYPFLAMSFNYITSTYSYVWEDYGGDRERDDYTVSGTSFIFGAGIAVMAGPHLSVVFEGNYHLDNLKPEDGMSVSGNIFTVGIGLAGFLY